MCLNTICRFHYHALLFVLKPFVKVLKLGLFLVFPPPDMPPCDEVFVAEMQPLLFISSPSRPYLQSVSVRISPARGNSGKQLKRSSYSL